MAPAHASSSSATTSSASSLPQKRTVEEILHRLRASPKALTSASPAPAAKKRRSKLPDYLTTSSQAAGPSTSPLKKRILSTSTRLFIKRVKIDKEKADEFKRLAATLGAVITDAEHANIILTDTWSEIRAKAGLRPNVYEEQAHVLHTSWLEDTAEQGISVNIDKYHVVPAPTSSDAFAHNKELEAGDTSAELASTDGEHTDSATDGESDLGPTKDMRCPLRGLWVHVLPVKLDKAGLETVKARVLALGANVVPRESADIIVSPAATAARIKPFLKDNVLKRPVLHTRWLDEVETKQTWVDPGDCYVADLPSEIQLSFDEVQRLSERKRVPPTGSLLARRALTTAAQASSEVGPMSSPKAEDSDEEDTVPPPLLSREGSEASSPPPSREAEPPGEAGESLDDYEYKNSQFACQRPSPLRCINQDLVEQLLVLQKQRELVGEKRSSLSYRRALSAIKAYRKDLRADPGAAQKIKGVGPKIGSLVKQFYETGNIAEVEQIRSDSALRVMLEFMDLYGIGPTTARELYNQGCRTFEDVIQVGRSYGTKLNIRECLKILPDLRQKIPRFEVESITATIMQRAEALFPGCLHTICGGYRRGKPASGDVDIVITHDKHEPGVICKALVEALQEEKLMTHMITLSHGHETGNASHTAHSVAEFVFKAKATASQAAPVHRRVDLIFCQRNVYGACVVGWTGSTMFERDIRLWAEKKMNWKFHNYGISNRENGELIPTPEEADVFEELGLEWIPPQFRNCDA